MPPGAAFLAFSALSFLLIVVPGPSVPQYLGSPVAMLVVIGLGVKIALTSKAG